MRLSILLFVLVACGDERVFERLDDRGFGTAATPTTAGGPKIWPLALGNVWTLGHDDEERVIEVRDRTADAFVVTGLLSGNAHLAATGDSSAAGVDILVGGSREPLVPERPVRGDRWPVHLDEGPCGAFEAAVVDVAATVPTAIGDIHGVLLLELSPTPAAEARCAMPAFARLGLAAGIGPVLLQVGAGPALVLRGLQIQGERSNAMTVSALLENPAAHDGERLTLVSALSLGPFSCTKMYCGGDNTCCNHCQAPIFAGSVRLEGFECAGNECDVFDRCVPTQPDERTVHAVSGVFHAYPSAPVLTGARLER